MILNYLLAISMLVLSVLKTSEIFINSNQALMKFQNEFIQQTSKSNFKNNRQGNISLTAAVFTTLLSALFLFYIAKMKIEYQEALYRKDSYLCVHYLNFQTQNYVEEMAKFNIALRSAFVAQMSKDSVAVALFKAIIAARNIRHLFYIKKMSGYQYCQIKETLSYFTNWPFEMNSNLLLNTNIDETTKLKNKKWSLSYYHFPTGIRWKNSFALKSTFSINGIFFPKFSVTTEEINPPVL